MRLLAAVVAALVSSLAAAGAAPAAALERVSLDTSREKAGMIGPGSPYFIVERLAPTRPGDSGRIVVPIDGEAVAIRQVHVRNVKAGETFVVSGEAVISNNLRLRSPTSEADTVRDVMYQVRLVQTTSPTYAGGNEISEAGGEYLLPDVHHWTPQASGTWTAPKDMRDVYFKLLIRASLARPLPSGATCIRPYDPAGPDRPYCGLDVDYPHGHLSAIRHSPAAGGPPGSSAFRARNVSGANQITKQLANGSPNPGYPEEYGVTYRGEPRSFKTRFVRDLGIIGPGDIASLSLALQVDARRLTGDDPRCTLVIGAKLFLSPDRYSYRVDGAIALDALPEPGVHPGVESTTNFDGREEDYGNWMRGTSTYDRGVVPRSATWQAPGDFKPKRMWLSVRSDAYTEDCDPTIGEDNEVRLSRSRSWVSGVVLDSDAGAASTAVKYDSGDSSERVASLDAATGARSVVYSLPMGVRAGDVVHGGAMARVTSTYYEVYPQWQALVGGGATDLAGSATQPYNFTELNPYEYAYHLHAGIGWAAPATWQQPAGGTSLKLAMWANKAGGPFLGDPPNALVPVRPDDGRLWAVRYRSLAP